MKKFQLCVILALFLFAACSSGSQENQDSYQAYIKEGEDFLKENSKEEGVVTLPSGLQYIVLKEGFGPKPTLTENVTVHYHGTLIDGTVFDSSVEKGEPLTFTVNQVVKGWQEALQLMPMGAKWKIFIPSQLGYGARARGDKIKPNSVLIFEMELLSINSQ
ncbi:FKBP-type peptidyl-prolyl cis-trans isomerase [Rhodocytophaga rosea]|uniref:Peptidyl-prolyl cis-trans isomerase n=1 Tax=Rhodocytophaga rosea TaxID=2704465 RepID=A0A6C0GE69_9BACT|nr:FKBP-type peptidyl-prolyl cis-trans isomerase [Rhodocytophaga rosea]QHT66124.1 FKBP-type peptidyl-prolyl cis-trans isomerase [Rhodocytophaga rosea]